MPSFCTTTHNSNKTQNISYYKRWNAGSDGSQIENWNEPIVASCCRRETRRFKERTTPVSLPVIEASLIYLLSKIQRVSGRMIKEIGADPTQNPDSDSFCKKLVLLFSIKLLRHRCKTNIDCLHVLTRESGFSKTLSSYWHRERGKYTVSVTSRWLTLGVFVLSNSFYLWIYLHKLANQRVVDGTCFVHGQALLFIKCLTSKPRLIRSRT